MMPTIVMVTVACGLSLLAGYLFGVRRGVAARDAMRAALAREEALRRDLATPDAREGLREVERILSPLLEKERVAQAIAGVDLGGGTRVELPRVLDAIAEAAGLSALVLSDDAGLPLAASRGSERAEVLAAVWSQLVVLADRVAASGEPAPVSVRVVDLDGRGLVHRIFTAGRERFLLTAVSRGGAASPEALEPAVAKLERVLVSDAWRV